MVIREALGDRLPKRALIVDDQQMFPALRHLRRAAGILTPRLQPVNSARGWGALLGMGTTAVPPPLR
jgi:hypothetical protein